MDFQLKYHHEAMKLLHREPVSSKSAADLLDKREKKLQIKFPASVREWYSLEDAVQTLASYSNNDSPFKIEELGEPSENWYHGGPKDFLSERLLLFMCENQGVCNWAIHFDDSEDPPVVVEVDTAPNAKWLPCADHFSTFVWCRIWDHSPLEVGVSAQETDFAESDLRFLQSNFRQLPITYGWPGRVNYRFESKEGAILIWDGQDQCIDWFLSARLPSDLKDLLAKVWHCGNLAESMYGDGEADTVLRDMRGRAKEYHVNNSRNRPELNPRR